MSAEITFIRSVADPDTLERFLTSYYEVMIGKMIDAGGPTIPMEAFMSGLWDGLDAFLPPNGAIALAHSPDGVLVGCGFLKKIRPDAAELKRLFVDPTAQGEGLGRRLIEARIDIARDMNIQDLFADTIKGNTQMLSLYAQLGFVEIDRYPENANSADLDPFLVYLHRKTDL